MEEIESEGSSLENLSLDDDSIESIRSTIGSDYKETEELTIQENILDGKNNKNNFINDPLDKAISNEKKNSDSFNSDVKNIFKGYLRKCSSIRNISFVSNRLKEKESGLPNSSKICGVPVYDIPSVPISNTPSVPISNNPLVPILNIPSVPITNIPSVPIPNIPSVPIPNIPSVPISNIPSVPISNIPSVPIPNIPSVPISYIPSVPTTNIQSVPISIIPSVPITNIPSVPTSNIPSVPTIPLVPITNIPSVPISNIPSVPIPNIPSVPMANIPSVPWTNIPSVLTSNIPSVPILNIPLVPITNIPSLPISNIPSIPITNIPSVPMANIPSVPRPNIPSVPMTSIPLVTTSNIPSVPMTSIPLVPISNIPSVPGKVPNIPGIPAIPGTLPTIPSLPSKVPNLPGIPSLPGKPQNILGVPPQIPGMGILPQHPQVQSPIEVQPKPPKDTNPKRIFWNIIPKNRIQNTFWMLQKLDAKVDYENLCKLFCEPKKKEEDKTSKLDSKDPANIPATTKAVVKLLDDKRLMNLGIALAKVNFTNDELKNILESFQEDSLSIEIIDKIISLAPNAEEIEKLKSYTGDTSLVTNGERFCLALISVHKFMNKLEFIKFKKIIDEEKKDIIKKLKYIKESLQSIRSSVSFLNILKLILKIGNYLNSDSAKGNAQGVTINTLNILDSIKGIGKEKNTLLDFVVMNVRSHESSLIDFYKDFVFFEEVLQIDLSDVELKIKEFENGIKKIVTELESLEKENSDLNKTFLGFLKDLNSSAAEKLDEIKGFHHNLNKELNDTAIYFGEDPKQFKIFDFVKLIHDFVNNFNTRSAKLSAEEAKQLKKQLREEKNKHPENKIKCKKDLDNIKQTVTRKTVARKTAIKNLHENNKEKLLDETKIEDKSTLGDISMVLNIEKIEKKQKLVIEVKPVIISPTNKTKIPVSILKNPNKKENCYLNSLSNENTMPETKTKINDSRISKARITKFKKNKAKESESEEDMDDCSDYLVDNDFLMINQPLKINKLSTLNNQHKSKYIFNTLGLFKRAHVRKDQYNY